MKKKPLLSLILIILFSGMACAELRVNRKNPDIKKFLVLKQLYRLSNSRSEVVVVDALNRIREVVFRNSYLPGADLYEDSNFSLAYMINRMNNDVDKIFEGLVNLDNMVDAANLDDKEDRAILSMVRTMILEEIKLILGSGYFQKCQDNESSLYAAYEKGWHQSSKLSAADRERNRRAIAKRQKLLDFAWYIYAEQSLWLMKTGFMLEKLDFSAYSMKELPALKKEIAYSAPPRLYISGNIEDYILKTH
ncbi:MAG: hypothetical protein Kow0029_15680 [Candidatus Rifleibacteriota bacterium]